jgi:RND superfamily putative drug exporter
MLNKLGTFIVRHRWWVILSWVILAVVITVFSPKLSDVTSSDQSSFLPDSYETSQAAKIADKAFPNSKNDVELLVVKRTDGAKLTKNDLDTTANAAKTLTGKHLSKVAVVLASPQSVSQDGTTQLMQVVMKTQASGDEAELKVVEGIRKQVTPVFADSGLQARLTGQMALNADSTSSFDTAEKVITFATFLLVILLPGIIFRSPVAAFAPVLAVSLVYSLAQSLIALAAKVFEFKISNQLSILYTVVLFGIGTDYILFLLFRYRERLRQGKRGLDVVAFALSRAGEAILSAALVVAAAFAALGISQFGIFKNLAPGLVICVLTMLLAVLTLIPAVVAVIGPKIFWPSKGWQNQPKARVSKWAGKMVGKRPLLVATLSFALLLALATGYFQLKTDYNTLSQLPQNTESTQAYQDVSKKFSASAISPTVVYVTSSKPMSQDTLQALQDSITQQTNSQAAGAPQASKDGKTAELSVYLQGNPYAASTLDYIKDTFRPLVHNLGKSQGLTTYVGGESAAFVDVRSVVNRDLAVILPVAAIIIFVILVLLLRSVFAPLYLLVAVALGYTATLGGTVYLFQHIMGKPGLIFFIPIMVYLFVVAIGTDYNILTMARLREEVRAGNKPRAAADLTIEHSSGTVASAGIILAGTFGSLALAGLSLLAQLGFAVAFGILLSAFVIAPLLVPSVAALLGYKVWWPGHRPAADKNRLP